MNLEKFQDYFESFTKEYFEYLSVYPTIYYGYDKMMGWACWAKDTEAGIKRMDVPLKDILTNPFNKDFYKLGDEKLEFELGAYIKQIFKLNKAELSSPDEDLVIVKRKKDYSENSEIEDFLMSLMTFPKQTYDLDEKSFNKLEEYFFLASRHVYEFTVENTPFFEVKELLTSYDDRFIVHISYETPTKSKVIQKAKNAFLIRTY